MQVRKTNQKVPFQTASSEAVAVAYWHFSEHVKNFLPLPVVAYSVLYVLKKS